MHVSIHNTQVLDARSQNSNSGYLHLRMRFLAEPYPKRSVRILFALPYPILGVSYFPYPKIGYVGPLGYPAGNGRKTVLALFTTV